MSENATRLGPAPTDHPIRFDVVLKPRDPSALASFAGAVSTPGNPSYRHFLPPGRLDQTFGPTPTTDTAVRSALKKAGFSPGKASGNGLVIPIVTTVAHAESGLHTRISSYRLPSGRTAFANTGALLLPTAIAPLVASIIGLNTTVQAQPQLSPPARPVLAGHRPSIAASSQSESGPQPCSVAATTATGLGAYTGDELAAAYSFGGLYSSGDFGSGVTVALPEFEPYEASDIATFQSCYGTNVPVMATNVDGGAGSGPGSGEAALDIETLIELAPQLHIDAYEAPNTTAGIVDDYTAIASSDDAEVVSTSWILCEAYSQGVSTPETSIFEEMAAQGQTVFAASGDSGSEGCMPKTGALTVPVGSDPVALAADPGTGTVYLANEKSHDVTVESESASAVVATASAGVNPDGIAVDPDSHNVYVVDSANPGSVSVLSGSTCNAVTHIDCATTTITGLGNSPAGVAVDPVDHTVYVANKGSGTVSVISESTDTVTGTVSLGTASSPVGVAVDDVTGDVYVTNYGLNDVSIIDGTTCNATEQTGCDETPPAIVVGDGPQGVAVDPATDMVYVADTSSSGLSVIDGASGTLVVSFGTPKGPTTVALSPGGGQVLLTGPGFSAPGSPSSPLVGAEKAKKSKAPSTDSAVLVISTATDKMTALAATGSDPVAIIVDPVTGSAYTADDSKRGTLGVLPLFLDVDDPASQPAVTGVGGTDLTMTETETAESAWGDPPTHTGAGGGGISSLFSMPTYQMGIINDQSSGVACGAGPDAYCREVPDVSASADPQHGYVIYYDGIWTSIGGTSAAAPLWAAFASLAVTLNSSVQRLGDINPDLYQFASAGYPVFNDVTTGNNDLTTTNDGAYAAGPGYDMATGLGSPVGAMLAAHLDPFVITTQPTSEFVLPGQGVTFTVATNGTPTPTVQWTVSTDGGKSFQSIPGATSYSYGFTATVAQTGDQFEAVLTNSMGSITTTAADLGVFSITTTSLPAVTPGTPYSVQLQATGGPTPYSWTYSGTLPAAMTLATTGLLSGKVKAKTAKPGSYSLTVTAQTPAYSGHPSLTASKTLALSVSKS